MEAVANILGFAGVGAGAALGNSGANAVQGGLNAESAVENNAHSSGGVPIWSECNSEQECNEIHLAERQAELAMAKAVTPIVDEVGRFFLTPYDVARNLSEAKTGNDVIVAIVLALPPAKIYDTARNLIRLGKNLDALNELRRLKKLFIDNPELATANGVKLPDNVIASVNHGKSGTRPQHTGQVGTNTRQITSSVKSDRLLLEEANKLSQQESQGINQMLEQIRKGNENPGVGTKVYYGITEFRHRNGGRIYAKKTSTGWEILGYSGKGNQSKVWNRLKELYGK